MKIVLSKLPKSGWWNGGVPRYLDNPAMQEGRVPNGILLGKERSALISAIKDEGHEVIEVDFPKQLDSVKPSHDFVFIRDSYISDQNGKVIILRAGEPRRRIENKIIITLLEQLYVKICEMPDKSGWRADGGEFFYCAKDKILFSGLQRNSLKGVEFVAGELDIDKVILLKGTGFHLDTFFTPILNKNGYIAALIICKKALEPTSEKVLYQFAEQYNVPLFNIPEKDALGTRKRIGKFAANALSLPGSVFRPDYFSNPIIDKKLNELGISVNITPTSQFQLSGGSVHCVTNEL